MTMLNQAIEEMELSDRLERILDKRLKGDRGDPIRNILDECKDKGEAFAQSKMPLLKAEITKMLPKEHDLVEFFRDLFFPVFGTPFLKTFWLAGLCALILFFGSCNSKDNTDDKQTIKRQIHSHPVTDAETARLRLEKNRLKTMMVLYKLGYTRLRDGYSLREQERLRIFAEIKDISDALGWYADGKTPSTDKVNEIIEKYSSDKDVITAPILEKGLEDYLNERKKNETTPAIYPVRRPAGSISKQY